MRKCLSIGLLALASAPASAVTLNQVGVSPTVNGSIAGPEYSLALPIAIQDGDNGFGGNNKLGDLFAAHDGTRLFIGLHNASLESGNGIVIFINSPRIAGGFTNPAFGTDQGEPGDSGTPAHAESLVTRANVDQANRWELPFEFADLAFGVVDGGGDLSVNGFPGVRSRIGLYRFASPNSGANLGFVPSNAVYDDNGVGNGGGLELSILLSDLGGLVIGDTVEVVAFITSQSGFTSNETLPAGLLNGGNPGFADVVFNNATISLTLAGPIPEPATATMMLVVAAAGMMRRRRETSGER